MIAYLMKRRGQGTFEYILLLGGVLLIVVLALVVLQSSFSQTSSGLSDVELKKCMLSAQRAPACFAGDSFQKTNTFDLLGYSANPVLCDCSDFNPDAFTVSVGQTLLETLDFASNTGFSPLFFEDAPTLPVSSAAYAISFPLPVLQEAGPSAFQFFLVKPDRSIVAIEPDAVGALPDGRVAYSWNSLPAGSRIKVNPLAPFNNEQKNQAVSEKSQIEDALVLEEQAGSDKVDKSVDSSTRLKLLKSKKGALRLVFVYSPTEDYNGSLGITLPVALASIARMFPVTSDLKADAENPESTAASWDSVRLKVGQTFPVIVELKPSENDLAAVSTLVDGQLDKLGGNAPVWKNAQPNCPVVPFIGLTLPVGCSTSSSGGRVSPSVSVSASPSFSPEACIQENQVCSFTSNLPGSIDRKCCSGFSCQAAGEGLGAFLTWQCLPDKNLPIPSPISSPSLTPSPSVSASPLPSCESIGGVCQNPVPQSSCVPGVENCQEVNLCSGGSQMEVTDEGTCQQTDAICCKVNGGELPEPMPEIIPSLGLAMVTPVPWTFSDAFEQTFDQPTKEAAVMKIQAPPVAKEASKGELCDPIESVFCASGLSCLPEDTTFPASRTTCQGTDAKQSTTGGTTRASDDPADNFKKTVYETLNGDVIWASGDVLGESADIFEERPLRFAECANAYCNCVESQRAVADFEGQALSHAQRINAEGSKKAVINLYGKTGWTEKGIVRTGTFADLQPGTATCRVFLAGKTWSIKPGSVYALTLNVPFSDGALNLAKPTADGPVELVPQWTYGVQTGYAQNENEFTRMIEVR